MTALPSLWVADLLRTITIAMWGTMLAQGFWTIWYAAKLRAIYHRLRRRHVAFVSVFWHVTTLVGAIIVMGTEISWKIIFQGVGKAGIGPWTYPNVAIYALANVALYLVLHLERTRYVKVRIKIGRMDLDAAGNKTLDE